ncbi:MAG: gliding motility-associated ABC transporter substrate-binding protein GldG [Crocinitomicaceae bacterium]
MEKKTKKTVKRSAIAQFVLIAGILVLINVIASFFNWRVDITEDKRYTLSENTIELLKTEDRLKDRIFFKIYLEGNLPSDMQSIRNNIQNVLDEFVAYAGDRVQYEFIDPNGEDDDKFNREVQDKLYNKGQGILPTRVQNFESNSAEEFYVWPGAIIEYGGTTVDVVQFFDRPTIVLGENLQGLVDNTVNDIEYKLISCIRRVTNTKPKSIGFLQGHGELSEKRTQEVRDALKKDYRVGDIEIEGSIHALEGIEALVVAKPTERFSEKDKFVIDQFIMNGGKVLWLVDPILFNEDSLVFTGETYGFAEDLNIQNDLLFKYGARINNDLIMDNVCTHEFIPPLHMSFPGTPWYFYPLVQSGDHPIVKNLDPIKFEYVSSVEIVNKNDTKVKKTVLLNSSNESKRLLAPIRINYGFVAEQFKPDFSKPKFGNNPMAVLLEGEFSSPFKGRISSSFADSDAFETKYISKPTKMIVVGDGNLIDGSYSFYKKGKKNMAPIPLNVDRFQVKTKNGSAKFHYGNKEFILNAIDYLLEDASLLAIRSKSISLRMLNSDKVKSEKSFWKGVNIVFPIMFICVFGFVLLLIRRNKYAK